MGRADRDPGETPPLLATPQSSSHCAVGTVVPVGIFFFHGQALSSSPLFCLSPSVVSRQIEGEREEEKEDKEEFFYGEK